MQLLEGMKPLLLAVALAASVAWADEEDVGSADPDKVGASAAQLLDSIHRTDRTQLALARLAAAGRGSVKIQLIGEVMLGSLGDLEAEVKAQASARNLTLRAGPADPRVAAIAALEGSDFDEEFLDDAVKRCDDAVRALEHTARAPEDPELAALVEYAVDTLTTARDDARRGRGEYVPLHRGD